MIGGRMAAVLEGHGGSWLWVAQPIVQRRNQTGSIRNSGGWSRDIACRRLTEGRALRGLLLSNFLSNFLIVGIWLAGERGGWWDREG